MYHFIDNGTYEQISLESKQIEQSIKDFLIENATVTIVFDKEDPIDPVAPIINFFILFF